MSARGDSKWRWRVARLLDHLPGMCWASLVSWVIYGPEKGDGYTLRGCRIDWMCRENDAQDCYCGKLRSVGEGT